MERLARMPLMRRILVILAVSVSVSVSDSDSVSASDSDSVSAVRAPVVVELFSSEGCSSCPPADTLLARLDHDQPVAGAQVIALEFHVDYWNQLGWTDPFSQATFTARQRMHAYYMNANRLYTPQMVVDGRSELVGSNASGAASAIATAARASHVAIKLSRQGDTLSIDAGAAPPAEGVTHLLLVTTERGLRTNVTAGENRGETLAHGPIVRTMRAIGDLTARGLTTQVQQPKKAGTNVVVLVEGRDTLHVLGAAIE